MMENVSEPIGQESRPASEGLGAQTANVQSLLVQSGNAREALVTFLLDKTCPNKL
jgi:hypothetical protein